MGDILAVKNSSTCIAEVMQKKLCFTTDYEGRFNNRRILVLIQQGVKSFEEVYGVIDGSMKPDITIKPKGKGK